MMDINIIQQLVCNPKETAKIDFKIKLYELFSPKLEDNQAARDKQWGELVKDIIALTNGNFGTAGDTGYLIIGADDKLKADSKPNLQSVTGKLPTRREIFGKVNSYCEPRLLDIECEEILVNEVKLFVISIPPSPYLHSLSKLLKTPKQDFSPHTVLLRRGDGEETYAASDYEKEIIKKEKEKGLILSNPSSEEVRNKFQEELNLVGHPHGYLPYGVTGAMESSYWCIRIFPQTYNAHLLERRECLNLIETTKVKVGGWEYPPILDTDQPQLESNYIIYLSQNTRIQCWSLYESGQFINISGTFSENPTNVIVDGEIIYTVTSVFKFAAKLCQQEIYAGGVNIEIALKNVGRYGFKFESDLNDLPSQDRIATQSSYKNTWIMQGNSSSLTSDDKGLDAIVWFAERFCSPQPISREVFKEKQEKLLDS
jgi:hypothetical protein